MLESENPEAKSPEKPTPQIPTDTRARLIRIIAPLAPFEDQLRDRPIVNPNNLEEITKYLRNLKKENDALLQNIWGNTEKHCAFEANSFQHVSLFCIPAVTATAHLMQPTRYKDEAAFEDQSSRTGIFLAETTISDAPTDFHTFAIGRNHLSNSDRECLGMEPKMIGEKSNKNTFGIPHSIMAYSVYESLRAAEFIAEKRGETISEEEKEGHYQYFSEILKCSGYKTPAKRAEMETMAMSLDALAAETDLGKELIMRTLRHVHTRPNLWSGQHTLNYLYPKSPLEVPKEWIPEFLRPNSKKAYESMITKIK